QALRGRSPPVPAVLPAGGAGSRLTPPPWESGPVSAGFRSPTTSFQPADSLARERGHPADLATATEHDGTGLVHSGEIRRRIVDQHHLVDRISAHRRSAAPGNQPDG